MSAYICTTCYNIMDIDEQGIDLKDAKCTKCGSNYKSLVDINSRLNDYLKEMGIK